MKIPAYNITVKRASAGVAASQWDAVIGKTATKHYALDTPILIESITDDIHNLF